MIESTADHLIRDDDVMLRLTGFLYSLVVAFVAGLFLETVNRK